MPVSRRRQSLKGIHLDSMHGSLSASPDEVHIIILRRVTLTSVMSILDFVLVFSFACALICDSGFRVKPSLMIDVQLKMLFSIYVLLSSRNSLTSLRRTLCNQIFDLCRCRQARSSRFMAWPPRSDPTKRSNLTYFPFAFYSGGWDAAHSSWFSQYGYHRRRCIGLRLFRMASNPIGYPCGAARFLTRSFFGLRLGVLATLLGLSSSTVLVWYWLYVPII